MTTPATETGPGVQAQATTRAEHEARTTLELPRRIATGMRWTLWLSLLTLPFNFATNFLLARIGPEALGTFGVLNVYIGFVFVFFFLGGCAVPMKFLPELDTDRRSSFLASYSLILLAGLVPWLLLVTCRPQLLEFLFGRDGGDPMFELQLIYLAPVCLICVLMITCLKGIMEMKWAQILDRSITFGLATVLLILFIYDRAWLKDHASGVVWVTYISLSFVAACAGFYRLVSLESLTGHPRFWLPPRFWTYTMLLQSSSVLNFLNTKLDYLFVLNAGGLAPLGKYVALTSIAGIVPRISGFIVDSLLPSMTNCLAVGDLRSASQVAGTYLRLLFPLVLGLSFAILAFVHPVLAIMGSEYFELAALVQIASLIAAIQSLNLFSNTIFTATDRVQHDVAARLVRTITFAGSFWPLWVRMQLSGAVISWGIGEVAYQIVSLFLLKRNPRVKLRLLRSYTGFMTALALAVLPARCGLMAEYATGVLLLSLVLFAFLLVARYSTSEIRALAYLITHGPAESLSA